MSKFNEFTEAFDRAVNDGDVEGAVKTMVQYVKDHSTYTHYPLAKSFGITQGYMSCNSGENRDATTLNTQRGQEVIDLAKKELGL